MNTTNTKPEAPDELDKLFSDFFKSQLKHPWPNAPVPVAAAQPSTAAPRVAARDHTSRARFTLAASVALALGACWALSSGFQPGERTNGTPGVPGLLPDSGADGKGSGTLQKMQENKAKEPQGNDTPKLD